MADDHKKPELQMIPIPASEELSRRITLMQTIQQVRTGVRPSQGQMVADLINAAYERNADAIRAATVALESVVL